MDFKQSKSPAIPLMLITCVTGADKVVSDLDNAVLTESPSFNKYLFNLSVSEFMQFKLSNIVITIVCGCNAHFASKAFLKKPNIYRISQRSLVSYLIHTRNEYIHF